MNPWLPLCALLLMGCSPNAESPSSPLNANKTAAESSVRQPAEKDAQVAPPISALPQSLAFAASSPPPARAEAKAKLNEARLASGASAPANSVAQSSELGGLRAAVEPTNRENYAHQEENPVKRAAEQPVSTFSIDVDTGSYANVRRFLNEGRLPPRDAVRVEEMINYFDYDYPLPEGRQPPFRVSTELAPTPWNPKTWLLAVGVKGYDLPKTQLPPANLVFLIDVSGSMEAPNKLELLKPALKLLIRQLRPEDKVAIAVYAGAAVISLEPSLGKR